MVPKLKFKLDPDKDYRKPENRFDLVLAWSEAMYQTGELDQQLRLMNATITEMESKLWLAFLWGCCYNFTGPFVIMSEFPIPPKDIDEFGDWYDKNFDRIRFDTDCRYRKSKMISCVKSYIDWLGGRTQVQAINEEILFNEEMSDVQKYEILLEQSNSWKYFGRLSCWNYLEAIALVTEHPTFDCPDFLLTEIEDSESNRNGVAFIINREDLVTKHGKKKLYGNKITPEELEMLSLEGERLFQEIVKALPEYKVRRFSVETIFCWTKKRFRARSSRYLGWDDERTIDEINFVKENWPELDTSKVFEARKLFLPLFMYEQVQGVNKDKMPVFFESGIPMDLFAYSAGVPWLKKVEYIYTKATELW